MHYCPMYKRYAHDTLVGCMPFRISIDSTSRGQWDDYHAPLTLDYRHRLANDYQQQHFERARVVANPTNGVGMCFHRARVPHALEAEDAQETRSDHCRFREIKGPGPDERVEIETPEIRGEVVSSLFKLKKDETSPGGRSKTNGAEGGGRGEVSDRRS